MLTAASMKTQNMSDKTPNNTTINKWFINYCDPDLYTLELWNLFCRLVVASDLSVSYAVNNVHDTKQYSLSENRWDRIMHTTTHITYAFMIFDVEAKWPRCTWRTHTPGAWQHTEGSGKTSARHMNAHLGRLLTYSTPPKKKGIGITLSALLVDLFM